MHESVWNNSHTAKIEKKNNHPLQRSFTNLGLQTLQDVIRCPKPHTARKLAKQLQQARPVYLGSDENSKTKLI